MAQVLAAVPVSASPSSVASSESVPPEWALLGGTTEPTPDDVTVNRSIPVVSQPVLMPVFSAEPTDDEFFRARIFEEPLVPVGGNTSTQENLTLANALMQYASAGAGDLTAPLEQFLASHQSSPWRASLLTNLGIVYRRTAHFSRALPAWEEAWQLAGAAQDSHGRAVADRAIGELIELNARLGRFDVLEELFSQIDGRDVRGSAAEKIAGARQGHWLMLNQPGDAFRCGPLALSEIFAYSRPGQKIPDPIVMCRSTRQGTSMALLEEVAAQSGLSMRIAKRTVGAELLLPAVVHWRVGHFASLLAVDGDRYLVRDPTFGDEMWVKRATLDAEASGYFLVRTAALPAGWEAVSAEEGATVWGKGQGAVQEPSCTGDCRPHCPTCGGPPGSGPPGPGTGMPVYRVNLMLTNLNIHDTPIWYTPPRGPGMQFRVSYNHRETYQPQLFSYANLGPRWTFDWLSYVEDDPASLSAAAYVYAPGGGRETYTGFNATTQKYAMQPRSQAVLTRTSSAPIRYERELSDGSIEVFSQPNGAVTNPRKVFLTELRDPQGNALRFTFDASFRVVAATDAIGQVTTLSYEHADPLKITKVTDPFGRTATFEYDATGRLQRITDLLGLTSSFTYGTADFIVAMTTPYGTTSFSAWQQQTQSWLDVTDPLGGRERIYYGGGLVQQYNPATIPAGMSTPGQYDQHYLNDGNTLYWDKLAMAKAPGDPAAAVNIHWERVGGMYQSSPTIESVKRPLENRVWYNYPGQTAPNYEGTNNQPSAVGRVLDDGTSQVNRTEYNSRGLPTKRIDPLGRETVYEYAANGLDLVTTKQKNGAGWDVLETRTYNSQHLPLIVTDAAGQTTTYTYNATGQVLTVTNAKNETTTYGYDTDGRLTSITGPTTGATTTYTYDAMSRVRTVTDADNYTLTYDYDAADRLTKTTYPDGTYEEIGYNRLDAERRRDRLGRWSYTYHDANRRVVLTRDPLNRSITQQWCACGSLEALVDANGNRTTWERDVQGRATKEIRADGRETRYAYETTTSRLKSVTDAKNQVMTYSYFLDDKLKDIVYTNEQIATPDVSFTYDAAYGRLATMVDGTGTTTYGYHAVAVPPALGAAKLASVDGPLVNDIITYSYDQLGRVTNRAINGVGVTWIFDALGRVTTEANTLGTFTYAYDGPTSRVATVSYPNGQTSDYAYLPNAGDHRLQTIHHKYPTGATLSKFDYTYNAAGNILTWRQQADTSAVLWEYGYDATDQLVSAIKRATDPQQTVLKRYAYGFDPAGNRTVEQIDDVVTGATYNNVNELVSQQPAGGMVFAGSVSEPATVMISGAPAAVTAANQFQATVSIVAGSNTVSITATDPTGNAATRHYDVSNSGSSKTFTYDANGNLTSDGTRTFEWDARNQLVAVTIGTHRSEFGYDGQQRRVRLVEKENSVVQSDTNVVWCGRDVCEERIVGGETISYFGDGFQRGTQSFFYTRDRLWSVREVMDGSAALGTRVDYDPFGFSTTLIGSVPPTRGFTGYVSHPPSGLYLAMYRAYDSDLGRWLSQDPLGDADGPNRYAYVRNAPVRLVDFYGLQASCIGQDRPPCLRYFHKDIYVSCFLAQVTDPQVLAELTGCVGAGALFGPAAAGACGALVGWYTSRQCRECATFCDEEGPKPCPPGNGPSLGPGPSPGPPPPGPAPPGPPYRRR